MSTGPNICVAGCGHWGKNLIRNFHQLGHLYAVCDSDARRAASFGEQHSVKQFTAFEDALADPDLDAVAIATPAESHAWMALAALNAGKDVFVEKPLALRSEDGLEMTTAARRLDRILMVGHLLEYHPVVQKLRDMIKGGELGDIRYIYSQRLNLGTVRMDENALWNFAPHDISVILYLLDLNPTDVSARGQSYLQAGIEDVVFMSMNFGGKAMGHVHVSWLDPHKIRRITIVGSKRMAVFDDLEPNEKLKIYDKGAEINTDYDTFAEYVGLRFGDITMPYIRVGEPLRTECDHFLRCVRERTTPLSDGRDGLRVVKVLEAASYSLKLNGNPVTIGVRKP